MMHAFPLDKTACKLTKVRGQFLGLDRTRNPMANGFSACMNLDTSKLPDLTGHCRWIDRSISKAGAQKHLGLFSVGETLYLVGYDGAHIAIYRISNDGYVLIHTFSETMTETEATALPVCACHASALYGGQTARNVYLYPFGYGISLDSRGNMVEFKRLPDTVRELKFRCVVLYQNRMFATDGHKIYASAVNSTDDFTAADAEDGAGAWSTSVSDDGDTDIPVLGLVRFQGRLYYFCKECFGVIRGGENPFRTEPLFDVGTVNFASVVTVDDRMYFLSKKGLMAFDGQKLRIVSEKLAIDTFYDGVGGFWNGQYYLGVPSDMLGSIYTYCPENDSWGSILCYGNPVRFAASANTFYMQCSLSGSDTVYALGQAQNGWTGQSVPYSPSTLAEKQLRAVRMTMEFSDSEKISCDLIVTRSDGTSVTYPLFSDVVGTKRMILTKRLCDIRGVCFAFSIRATGGAVVSDFELIFPESEEII